MKIIEKPHGRYRSAPTYTENSANRRSPNKNVEASPSATIHFFLYTFAGSHYFEKPSISPDRDACIFPFHVPVHVSQCLDRLLVGREKGYAVLLRKHRHFSDIMF